MDAGLSNGAPGVSLGLGGQSKCGRAENRGVTPRASGPWGHGVAFSGSLRPRLIGAGGACSRQRSPGESCSGTHTWDYQLYGCTTEQWQLGGIFGKVGNATLANVITLKFSCTGFKLLRLCNLNNVIKLLHHNRIVSAS